MIKIIPGPPNEFGWLLSSRDNYITYVWCTCAWYSYTWLSLSPKSLMTRLALIHHAAIIYIQSMLHSCRELELSTPLSLEMREKSTILHKVRNILCSSRSLCVAHIVLLPVVMYGSVISHFSPLPEWFKWCQEQWSEYG